MKRVGQAEPALLDPSLDRFPVGLKMRVSYPDFAVELTLIARRQLCFHIADGPFATIEIVPIDVVPLGQDIFVVSWREKNGATVVNVQDYGRLVVHAYVTMRDGRFIQMAGGMTITRAPALVGRSGGQHTGPSDADATLFQLRNEDMTAIKDNEAERRFELPIEDGERAIAAAYYRRDNNGNIVLTHTEVPSEFGGRGFASRLAQGVFDLAREKGEQLVLQCPFMGAWYAKHRQYADVVAG